MKSSGGHAARSGRRLRSQLAASFLVLSAALALSAAAVAASLPGWAKHLSAADSSLANPLANDATAIPAGQKLYGEKCARCHGADALGKGHHPSLRTEQMHDATPGDIFWMVTHGAHWRGMPGFAKKLTDNQRWQIVSYVKSLSVTEKK